MFAYYLSMVRKESETERKRRKETGRGEKAIKNGWRKKRYKTQ